MTPIDSTSGPIPAGLPTIFALSSGPGRAGIAVVRLSGGEAGPALDAMVGTRPKPRVAAFRRVRHPVSAEALDDALVLFFPGPRSETGEDMAEFHLHGSPAVVRSVLAALGDMPGCRLAGPGEFARRAFANGKLDLTAAEGLADLIDADTDAQRRQALQHLGGAFARLCESWRVGLLEARALAEAAIDFSDEADVAASSLADAIARARPLLAAIDDHLAGAHRGEIVRDGFRVVLAGPPNAGKSSLLNALARRDAAIVSPEPGTTRDIVEVRLDLAGYAVIVADTAGLRDAPGDVEQEGMRRALARAADADLVLWLVDAGAPVWSPPDTLAVDAGNLMVVLNKTDLANASSLPREGVPTISALTGDGMADLVTHLAAAVAARLEGSGDAVLPTQARHRAALADAAIALGRLLAHDAPAPELAAEDLRLAADAIGRITGRVDPEEVLGLIFGRFCIGK